MNIRQYKKKYYICNDDLGSKLYVGDIVEIHNDMETKTSHQSKIMWNMLDGAFINSHPVHISMKSSVHRGLRGYLINQDYVSCIKVKSFNKV